MGTIRPVESTVKDGPNAESYPMIESVDFRGSFTGPADMPAAGLRLDESEVIPGTAPTLSAGGPPGVSDGDAVESAALPCPEDPLLHAAVTRTAMASIRLRRIETP